MCARADAANRLSGIHGRLAEAGTAPPSRENQEDQGRGPETEDFHFNSGKKTVPISGKTERGNSNGARGTFILPQPSNCPGQSPCERGTGLLSIHGHHSQYEGEIAVVGGTPLTMEWEALWSQRNRQ